jgi:hypothetical protein
MCETYIAFWHCFNPSVFWKRERLDSSCIVQYPGGVDNRELKSTMRSSVIRASTLRIRVAQHLSGAEDICRGGSCLERWPARSPAPSNHCSEAVARNCTEHAILQNRSGSVLTGGQGGIQVIDLSCAMNCRDSACYNFIICGRKGIRPNVFSNFYVEIMRFLQRLIAILVAWIDSSDRTL